MHRTGRTLVVSAAWLSLVGGLLALGTTPAQAAPGPAAVAVVPAATGRPWPGHPDRRVIGYRVHRGDTATVIAVRFHAWTAELLRVNHRSARSLWRVGERVRVPVVVSRAHAHGHRVGARHGALHAPRHTARDTARRTTHHARHRTVHRVAHPGRARVRTEITRVARAYGVRHTLALAVAWQESGWQQHVRSPKGAVGAMQVMPGTGRWLSTLVGRRLDLRDLHDNAVAGVVLLKLLRRQHSVRYALAGYYQGIGSVAEHGMYRSTSRYVRAVSAHWAHLRRGWDPA